jgi:hypothetical protein
MRVGKRRAKIKKKKKVREGVLPFEVQLEPSPPQIPQASFVRLLYVIGGHTDLLVPHTYTIGLVSVIVMCVRCACVMCGVRACVVCACVRCVCVRALCVRCGCVACCECGHVDYRSSNATINGTRPTCVSSRLCGILNLS